MKQAKHRVSGIVAGCAVLVVGCWAATCRAAETCVWTGGGGDGLWSNAANWQGNESPSAETTAITIVLSGLTAPVTLNNDIEGLSVQTLALTSDTQKVTFKGKTIAVAHAATFSTAAFQIEAPLAGAGTVDFFCGGQITFSGANSAEATGAWTFHRGNLLIWKIAYPFGKGPVRVESGVSSIVFRREEALANDFTLCGGVTVEANASLVFNGAVTATFGRADETLTFKTTSQSTYSGSIGFAGGLQVATGTAAGTVALGGSLSTNAFSFAKASDLGDIRLTHGSQVTRIDLGGKELRTSSLTAAPSSSGVCLVQSTGGAGTLAITDDSEFAVRLGEDVRLVADGCAVTLTDAAAVEGADLGVANGGTFVVPDEEELSVGRFFVDGVAVRPGRFSSTDVDSIKGNGVLSVTRYVPVAASGTETLLDGRHGRRRFPCARQLGRDVGGSRFGRDGRVVRLVRLGEGGRDGGLRRAGDGVCAGGRLRAWRRQAPLVARGRAVDCVRHGGHPRGSAGVGRGASLDGRGRRDA